MNDLHASSHLSNFYTGNRSCEKFYVVDDSSDLSESKYHFNPLSTRIDANWNPNPERTNRIPNISSLFSSVF